MTNLKNKIADYYEKNETKVDLAFFIGGFLFDIVTLSDIDDPISIIQQIIYLLVTGLILYYEFLIPTNTVKLSPRVEKIWEYRQPVFHFVLGSLLSIYSLFFLKSSSFFSSVIFVVFILGLMIANELKSVQKSEVNIKIALYVVCVFSFFSMIVPVILGFVGLFPFLISLSLTVLFLLYVFKKLKQKVTTTGLLIKKLLVPGFTVSGLFLAFYMIGWIPPVPLSTQSMGIYHNIEKVNGEYALSHEKPWWNFWHNGDQKFYAQAGDKVFFFTKIFCPGRFSDSLFLQWSYKDQRLGWKETDRIPLQVTGGRKNGYRGYAIKQNYTPGDWRVSVQTTDGREIGRIYFEIMTAEVNPNRAFEIAYEK